MSEWNSFMGDQEFEEAKNLTFKYLSYRERSEKEVREYLEKKEYGEEVIDAVIARMKDLDYVNDRRFTKLWVKNRANSRRKGSEFLKNELREKGISVELIEDIIAEEYSLEDEYETAYEAARKKLKSYPKNPEAWKPRLWRFLAQRGFNNEIIIAVLNKLLEEENQF